jgi:hypothetical protein
LSGLGCSSRNGLSVRLGLVDDALHDLLFFGVKVCGEGFVELRLFLLEFYMKLVF